MVGFMAPSRVVFSNGLEQPGIHPVCDQMMPKYTYGYRLHQAFDLVSFTDKEEKVNQEQDYQLS